jgi:hypothetical protein
MYYVSLLTQWFCQLNLQTRFLGMLHPSPTIAPALNKDESSWWGLMRVNKLSWRIRELLWLLHDCFHIHDCVEKAPSTAPSKQDHTTANSNQLILVPPYGTKVELMQNRKAYKNLLKQNHLSPLFLRNNFFVN